VPNQTWDSIRPKKHCPVSSPIIGLPQKLDSGGSKIPIEIQSAAAGFRGKGRDLTLALGPSPGLKPLFHSLPRQRSSRYLTTLSFGAEIGIRFFGQGQMKILHCHLLCHEFMAPTPEPCKHIHLKPEGYVALAGGRGGGRSNTGFRAAEVTPLVVNGTMYIASPYGQVVALDPISGEQVWVYKTPAGDNPATRGVEYFAGEQTTPPRSWSELRAAGCSRGTPKQAF
jgi:hypothetical protein